MNSKEWELLIPEKGDGMTNKHTYMCMHTHAHINLNKKKNIESLVFYSFIFHLVHTFLCVYVCPSSFLLKS